jgi:heat-inducible transcriptional repressor
MTDLNHRARKILAAIVQEYLATGDAVGSRTVTRRHGVELSAATVRNVMADLEEAGLLKQPHTSAGRVPTDQGLRFFVDSLLKVRALSPREREEMRARYDLPTGELDSALREATKVLSDLSQHTVVLTTPRVGEDRLEHLEFMLLPSGSLLAVLVTKGGQVQNKLVMNPGFQPGGGELERINNYLNAHLDGLTLAEVRDRIVAELASERAAYDVIAQRALELSQMVLPPKSDDEPQVIIEGHARLLDQATDADVAKMKAMFHALEEKRLLVELLEKTSDADGLQVFIGAEAQLGELTDLSVVAASYGSEEKPLGTLGVIGPTRMNYAKVIALVDFTSQILSNMIDRR